MILYTIPRWRYLLSKRVSKWMFGYIRYFNICVNPHEMTLVLLRWLTFGIYQIHIKFTTTYKTHSKCGLTHLDPRMYPVLGCYDMCFGGVSHLRMQQQKIVAMQSSTSRAHATPSSSTDALLGHGSTIVTVFSVKPNNYR